MDENYDMYDSIIDLDKQISNLSGIPLLDARGDLNNPVGNRMRNLLAYNQVFIDCYKKGDRDTARRISVHRHQIFLKIMCLKINLQQISDYNKEILRSLCELLSSATEDNYYGYRLEIAITALLIRYKIPFTKRESPDFEFPLDKVFMECTSTHFNQNNGSQKSPESKISDTIQKKTKKPYANGSTVLFIDITNVHSYSTDSNNLLRSPDYLSDYISTVPNYSKYGSIVTLVYLLDPGSKAYSYNIASRTDTSSLSPELRKFLDAHFLSDVREVSDRIVPRII